MGLLENNFGGGAEGERNLEEWRTGERRGRKEREDIHWLSIQALTK